MRVPSRFASTVSKPKAARNWTLETDTLRDSVGKHMAWTDISNKAFPYPHSRPLTNKLAQQALNYITAIVRRYPFQLRYSMAMPLWERFCETWCDTGDEKKSLLSI